MKKEYIIIASIIIVVIAALWYVSKKNAASQTASTPDSGGGVVGGSSPIVSTPSSDLTASLFDKFKDILGGVLGAKSSTAINPNIAPISNVIQDKPFSNPIAAPLTSPVTKPSDTVVITNPNPDRTLLPTVGTPSVPKLDVSAPIAIVKPVNPILSRVLKPVTISSAPPPSNTISSQLLPHVSSGSSVIDAVKNAAIDKINAAILAGGHYEKYFEDKRPLFETL